MRVKTDCKNARARARERETQECVSFSPPAKNAGRGVLFPRIDSAGCKKEETPRTLPGRDLRDKRNAFGI